VNRRQLLFASSAAILTSVAHAQERIARVALVSQGSAENTKFLIDALLDQMSKYGWREGVNVEYIMRFAAGDRARLDVNAAEAVATKPALILASNPVAVMAVRKHTNSIPIIFSSVYDPVDAGFVASLSRPGGNLTGMTTRVEGLWGKRLQLLREALPSLARVGVMYDPTDAEDKLTFGQLRDAGKELSIETLSFHVRQPDDIAASFAKMSVAKVGAAVIGGSYISFSHRKVMGDAAIAHRIPAFGVTEDKVEAGFLMSYGIDLVVQYRQTARYVDRVLRGARPGDLPVERPNVFRLAINLKTAKALGVTVARSILLRADRVIE